MTSTIADTARVSYSVAEAAAAVGVSPRTIDRACKALEAEKIGVPLLPSKFVGTRRVISRSALLTWVDSLPDG